MRSIGKETVLPPVYSFKAQGEDVFQYSSKVVRRVLKRRYLVFRRTERGHWLREDGVGEWHRVRSTRVRNTLRRLREECEA